MNTVLDACAVIAFLRDEEGAEKVEFVLLENECFIHGINLCEVYKDCLKRGESREVADQMIDDLESIGIKNCVDLDNEFWKFAAIIKASRKIALADCFAIALAKRLNCELLSSDHELDSVNNENICRVNFIR